jgi:hypothetical protein
MALARPGLHREAVDHGALALHVQRTGLADNVVKTLHRDLDYVVLGIVGQRNPLGLDLIADVEARDLDLGLSAF